MYDYILKMKGTDKDLAAHFTVIRHRGRCLFGLPVEAVFGEVPEADYMDSIRCDVAGAQEEIVENPMYMTLNLARVLAYRTEGLVTSKKEGGEWGMKNLPQVFRPLIQTALDEYENGTDAQYDQRLAAQYAQYMLDRIMPG